jgi:hypothetical protein
MAAYFEIAEGIGDQWGRRERVMGYNTAYDLSIEPYDEGVHKILLDKVNRGYNPFEDTCKWYEWEEEMRAFSIMYPDYLFHLHGYGEGEGDIWAATFKAGKAHIRYAEIIIDPFEEDKLE